MEVTFSNPIYLWGLLAIPALVAVYYISSRYSREMALKFANFVALSRVSGGIGELASTPILVVRMSALVCVILSISGMTFWYMGETSNKDYVLAIDSSASMMQTDFAPNRLEAAKIAAVNFVENLPIDSSVGVIGFAGVSFVEQPITKEKSLLRGAIANMSSRAVGGTDFGNAIITACNILSSSKKSRAIILLTDGRSNIGVSEDRAILYAIDFHTSVYTIGVGSNKTGDKFDLGVDEASLRRIAELTNGKYFGASDTSDLEKVYLDIIKNPVEGNIPIDLSFILLLVALLLLLSDWLLGNTIYRRIP